MNQASYRLLLVAFGAAVLGLGALWGCSPGPQYSLMYPGTQATNRPDAARVIARLHASSPHRSAPILAIRPGEELWVIVKPERAASVAEQGDQVPGCGMLLGKLPTAAEQVPVPLKHTDVSAEVTGYIVTVDVRQQYHNPFNEKIEAVYMFPLPQDAAVSEFQMTIGERNIRGVIRERAEAEKIYHEARSQGHVAALLTQERPNIFTQSVANIEPGKAIDVNIKYYHTLAFLDGWHEFVFPMVVGPRFNPPGATDGIGATGYGSAGRSVEQREVQYLRPQQRSGHDIALRVDIDAAVSIERLESPTHRIETRSLGDSRSVVTLRKDDSIPDRDFVLRYKVAGERVKSAFVSHNDPRGGFFTLMLYPPDSMRGLPRQPMEIVFVLDASGSMNGEPIRLAKDALGHALKQLRPEDTFQIVRFSDSASQLGPAPVAATPENIRRAMSIVREINGEGGTMMIEGIRAALDFPHDERRLRFVCFLTDGFIGNEADVLTEIHRRLGATRIFSFGIGSAPNRYLLEQMAIMGRGAAAYAGPGDDSVEIMSAFMERVTQPALMNVGIDWGGMQVSEVYPQRIPDLFVGRPIVVTGRFSGAAPSQPLRVSGRSGGRDVSLAVPLDHASATIPALPRIWARMKIADLSQRSVVESQSEYQQLVRSTALEYELMSAYTAFVAVDSATRTAGAHGTTVAVPVPVPQGVRYETAVGP